MNREKLAKLKNITKDIKLLYAEDNDLAREKTAKILKKYFPLLDVAKDGQEALGLYMKKHHDLILTDISMPRINGLELVKSIKGINEFQRVILISAYQEVKYLTNAIDMGVDGFIFKPINLDNFLNVVVKLCLQIQTTKQNRVYKDKLEDLVRQRTHDLEQRNKALKSMINELRKSNQLKEEMKIAQRLQENFLPKELPHIKSLKFASFFQAAQFIGGDYYDCFYSHDKAINIVIADVAGHGVAPAITMSTFRGFCRSILSNNQSFQEQVETINSLICNDSKKGEFFITAFFVRYYEHSDGISYISAGHNDMLLCRPKQGFQKIKSTSLPLGVFDNVKYEPSFLAVNKDDFLFLYTDGLIESSNQDGEYFTLLKVERLIYEVKDEEILKILEYIVSQQKAFTTGLENGDDITIFICQFI